MDPCASPRAARRHRQHRHPHHTHRHGRTNITRHPSNGPGPKRRRHEHGQGDAAGGKSKRLPDHYTGDNLVQIWLEKTGATGHGPGMKPRTDTEAVTTHRSRSHQNRDEVAPDRLFQSHAAWQQSPRQVGRGHRVRSPVPALNHNSYRRHEVHGRKRPASADSSLLSVVDDHGSHSADPASSLRRAYADDETPSGESRRKVDAHNQEILSERSATPGSPCFERRPRRKTREDKYDKKEKLKPVEAEERLQRRHKSQKNRRDGNKRALMSSKNVMSNFNPKAVLNDRITVSHIFKPGIFQNGREAAGTKPIPDLSFSDMRFLQDRKHDTKPKPLSKKRLRELERQNKEMEEVSSFFLPQRVDGDVRLSQNDQQNDQQNITERFEVFQAQRSNTRTRAPAQTFSMYSASRQGPTAEDRGSFRSYGHASQSQASGSSEIPRTRQDSSKVSKETTYYAGFSNRTRSPSPPKRRSPPSSPRLSPRPDSYWSRTPESTRRALVATGLYRGTGICPYDNTVSSAAHERQTSASGVDIRSDRPPTHDDGRENSFSVNTTPEDWDLATMTDDQAGSILHRWRNILPSNWRTDRNESRPETAIERQAQSDSGLPEKSKSNDHLQDQPSAPKESTADRHKVGEEARLHVQGNKGKPFQPLSVSASLNKSDPYNCESKQGVEVYQDWQLPGSDDRASIASRDVMPPPPVPQSRCSPRPVGTPMNSEGILGGHGHVSSEETPVARQWTTQFGTEQINATDSSNMSCNPPVDGRSITIGDTASTAGTFTSIQPASWIPHAQTPPIPALPRNANPSRNSLRLPIYVSQSTEAPERMNNNASRVSNAQNGESMACFIARIEREVEEQPLELPRENTSPGINQTSTVIPFEGSYGDQRDGRLDNQNASYLDIPNLEGEQYTGPKLHDGELNYHEGPKRNSMTMEDAYQWNNAPVPRSLYQSEKGQAEKLEMSAFWRPNQFTQF